MLQLDVFTLFPEAFTWFCGQRHVKNVCQNGVANVQFINPRDYTELSGKQVDDTPFGGGAGMVLRVDVFDRALSSFYGCDATQLMQQRRVVALTPTGRVLDDALAKELSQERSLTLLCGRYEGFDQRILDHFVSDQISIGRYVLAGGELPAMVLMDSVIRKLPDSLGDPESVVEESYSPALLGLPEYPHYTRPAQYRGWSVPSVLLSGHHQLIREWRQKQSRKLADEGQQ